MRLAADELAAAGFVVLVPDLFWRLEPGIELGYSDEDRQVAVGYWGQFNNELGASDAAATAAYLKAMPECSGKVAMLGFCLGGKMAVMSAAQAEADAVVSFYGVKLQENIAELKAMPCPLQLHVGDNDLHVPMDVVNQLKEELADNANAETYVYPGAVHGFFNKVREGIYHPEASAAAEEHTLNFLRKALA